MVVASYAIAEPEPIGRTTTLSGRVLDEPGGGGVAEISVNLWLGHSGRNRVARTDSSGGYTFDQVEPGFYALRIVDRRPGVFTDGVKARVHFAPVAADDLHLTLPQYVGGAAFDEQTKQPVAGAEIVGTTTDEHGRYRRYVHPGPVNIGCRGSHAYYPAGIDHGFRVDRTATVAAGQSIDDLDFALREVPRFAVHVLRPDGRPAANADITVAHAWSGPDAQGIADFKRRLEQQPKAPGEWARGSSFSDFMPERWWVRRRSTDEGRLVGHLRRSRIVPWRETVTLAVLAATQDRTLVGRADRTTDADKSIENDIVIQLALSGSVTFNVVDHNDQPIDDPKITLSEEDGAVRFRNDLRMNPKLEYLGSGRHRITGFFPGSKYGLHIVDMDRAATFELESGEHRDVGTFRPRIITEADWQRSLNHWIEGLRGDDPCVRETAARRLTQFGERAAPAVPDLIELMDTPGKQYYTARGHAARALGGIGPKARAAVPRLIRHVQLVSDATAREAAEALGHIGDPSAIDPLIEALGCPDPDVRRSAVMALGQFASTHPQKGIPVLIRAIGDRSRGPQEAAIKALGDLGLTARDAVPALIKLIGPNRLARHSSGQVAAADALGDVGDAAALPALHHAMRETKDGALLRAAARAIVKIESTTLTRGEPAVKQGPAS